MKLYIALFLGFVLTCLIGSIIIEQSRIAVGSFLGYESQYFPSTGSHWFYNPSIGEEFDLLKANKENLEEIKASEEWKEIYIRDNKALAKIQLGGILMAIILLILGIYLLRKSRSVTVEMKWYNWLGFFLSIVYFRYLVQYSLFFFMSSITCQDAAPYVALGLNGKNMFYAMYSVLGIGIIIALLLVFQIPKIIRLKLIGIGALGGLLGYIIWVKFAPYIYSSNELASLAAYINQNFSGQQLL